MPEEALRFLDAQSDIGHLLSGGVSEVMKCDPLGDGNTGLSRIRLEDSF